MHGDNINSHKLVNYLLLCVTFSILSLPVWLLVFLLIATKTLKCKFCGDTPGSSGDEQEYT